MNFVIEDKAYSNGLTPRLGTRAANYKTIPIFVRRQTEEKIFARGGQHKPLKRLNPAKGNQRKSSPFSWLSLAPPLLVFARLG
jgi:hypothetical protein